MDEPLVLLPGMMCDARLFHPQIELFSSNRSLMVMELKGKKTMAGLAKSVLERAPERFALAGLSMGGIVAMEIIRQEPDRVTRLALMDTNPLADPPEKAAQRKSQINRVMAGALRSVMRDEIKPNYLCHASKSHDILNICMDMAQDLGPKVFQDQSSALQNRPDQCNTLQLVNVPSLVLCGENDQLCPVSRHILMHDLINGSRLEIIPRAGHLPTLEQPELTNRKLKEWLKQ
jgi:pimeloyl-ACP methyl ester carboxylesterase